MNDVSNRTDCVNDADYQTLMLCDTHNYIFVIKCIALSVYMFKKKQTVKLIINTAFTVME